MTYVLGVRRRNVGNKDARGNAEITYADPAPWPVRALAPGAFNEDGTQNRDRLEVVWTVFADKDDTAPTALDRVDVAGDTYEVNGQPQDWTLGPTENQHAGLVVELKRKTG